MAGDSMGRWRGGQPARGSTGWQRGGSPDARDGIEWRHAGDATALQLAVLHRVDPSVVVSSDGGAG
jgi:hypothetical protein